MATTNGRTVILSKACEYAIRVSLHLAAEPREGFVPVRELAAKCAIPYHFLGKICGLLTQHAVLVSHKGPHGGVMLAQPPEAIRLITVIEAIDGWRDFDRCVLGMEPCSHELPCPVHRQWVGVKDSLRRMFSDKTLRQLVDELAEGKTTMKQTRPVSGPYIV